MGGGGSKGYGPSPPDFVAVFDTPPNASGNYQLFMHDGKDSTAIPLKDNGKPIIVGRSTTAGSTVKSDDEGTSAQHLSLEWDTAASCWQAKVRLWSSREFCSTQN